ncbi:hypothetical protein V1478_015450 [Vespula squamosa]|uniref:Uncharacterized protein n=1 Tax=Vespula squamosa TaxID=30214 RepID=A0ABD2A5H5_VESSQ
MYNERMEDVGEATNRNEKAKYSFDIHRPRMLYQKQLRYVDFRHHVSNRINCTNVVVVVGAVSVVDHDDGKDCPLDGSSVVVTREISHSMDGNFHRPMPLRPREGAIPMTWNVNENDPFPRNVLSELRDYRTSNSLEKQKLMVQATPLLGSPLLPLED